MRIAYLWNPAPALFADELEQYVAVRSIVTTGVDLDGKLEPFLYSRLQRNPPLYGIAGYASTLVFGKTPFGWRFPAAVFGLIGIALLYRIVLELTRRRDIALLAALLLAIDPMHVHFSRIGWEPATVLPVLLGSIALLLAALRDEDGPLPFPLLAAAALLAGASPYTYPASWFYVTILVGSLLAFHPHVFRDRDNRRKLAGALALALIVAGPGLWIEFTDPHIAARGVRMLTFAQGVNPSSLAIFARNYARHFGLPYLFTTGTSNPMYMNGYGALYWWFAPLLLAGFLAAGRYLRTPALWYWLLIWLIAYPLGGALTNDGTVPHPARTIAGLPMFCIFAAIGFAALYDGGKAIASTIWRRCYQFALAAGFAVAAVLSVSSFSAWYFQTYPAASAAAWESGSEEAFAAVRAREAGYTRLCMIGFSYYHIRTLQEYYLPKPPLEIVEGDPPECAEPSTLILDSHLIYRPGFAIVDTIRDSYGNVFAVLAARAAGS